MSPIAHDHPSDLDFPSSKRLKIIHNLPAASMPVTLADLEDTTMVSAPDTPAASGVDDNNNTDRMNSDADGAAMGGGHAAAVASAQGAAFGDLDAELHGEHTHSTQSANNNFSASQPATASAASNGAAVIPLQIKRLTPSATVPTRGSAFAAGYDLYASEDSVVPGRGKAMVATGIAIAVPPQTYGRVAPRSGLAAKHSIATGAGVIDYDYRGEVKVILFNHSDADFKISVGDRIAQLVLERIVTPDVVEVEELEETVRGEGGLGVQGGLGGWLGMGRMGMEMGMRLPGGWYKWLRGGDLLCKILTVRLRGEKGKENWSGGLALVVIDQERKGKS